MNSSITISQEIIERKIYLLRGKKVMFDDDIAVLYGVKTKVLNQAVKRNIQRFPPDFIVRLSKQEMKIWSTYLRSQFVTSSWGGRRYNAYAFTEQGVAMLSSVLNSGRAIQVNIQIMRTFVRLRELIASNKVLQEKFEKMEKKYDYKFKIIFDAMRKLLYKEHKPKKPIGFEIK